MQKNVEALDEFMVFLGFEIEEVDDYLEDERKYVKNEFNQKSTLILKNCLFDENNNFKDIRSKETLEKSVIWEQDVIDNELPF